MQSYFLLWGSPGKEIATLSETNLTIINDYLTKLMMYHEIHRMSREGLSVSKISRALVLNWRTVKNNLSMSERDFDEFMKQLPGCIKNFLPFKTFIKDRLVRYPDTFATQMHDWLKEQFSGFPSISPKTVFNFVVWVRQHYHIPKTSTFREYEVVEELSCGKQAQVDFGQYNLRDNTGKNLCQQPKTNTK